MTARRPNRLSVCEAPRGAKHVLGRHSPGLARIEVIVSDPESREPALQFGRKKFGPTAGAVLLRKGPLRSGRPFGSQNHAASVIAHHESSPHMSCSPMPCPYSPLPEPKSQPTTRRPTPTYTLTQHHQVDTPHTTPPRPVDANISIT